MGIELFEHNQTAYYNMIRMLQECGRAAVIHPTGSGKSFIAFKLVEDNPDARICWLAPSEYIFRSQKEAFLKAGGTEEELYHVKFLTYARLLWNEDNITGLIGEERIDYIILDEFHRCGAAEWGKGVRKLLEVCPDAKILGLSATNIRYLDAGRDMAEELFGGWVASRMDLGEAIARNILPAPLYVTAFYSYGEELRKLEAKAGVRGSALYKANEEKIEKLRRCLQNAEGPEKIFARYMEKDGKYIVFCADKEHMDEMLGKAGEWFAGVDSHPRIYQAYYENSGSIRAFRKFSEDDSCHLKLLFCIDMLNEGIHVDGVDGVVLLRPTVSPTLYLQQVGRALSAAGKRYGGLVKQPVILDMVNNFDSLYCIDSLRQDIQNAMRGINKEAEKETGDSFRVIDEVKDIRCLFEEIRHSLTAGWDFCFHEAERYHEKFGNLRVPKKYVTDNGIALGNWIVTQRKVRAGTASGNLTGEQIRKLDGLGMVWESRSQESWETGYRELLEYRKRHGNVDVTSRYVTPSGYALGKWVSNQRLLYNCTTGRRLSGDRVKKLDEVGFIWGKTDYEWERYYAAASQYYKKEGNLDVPSKYCTEDGLRLGSWIQAKRRGKEMLTPQQIQALEAVGMIWESSSDARFEEKYRLARQFYEENGHLNVPVNYTVEGVKLGRWISLLRSVRSDPSASNYRLTAERIARLNSIGMVWMQDSWETRYRLAESFYREHGNLRIPQNYVVEGNIWLGKWLARQRKNYRSRDGRSTLSEDRVRRLEAIGMSWDVPVD